MWSGLSATTVLKMCLPEAPVHLATAKAEPIWIEIPFFRLSEFLQWYLPCAPRKGPVITPNNYRRQLTKVATKHRSFYSRIKQRRGPLLLHANEGPHRPNQSKNWFSDLKFCSFCSQPIAPTDFHLFLSLQHFLADKIYNDFSSFTPLHFYNSYVCSLTKRWRIVSSSNSLYTIDKNFPILIIFALIWFLFCLVLSGPRWY